MFLTFLLVKMGVMYQEIKGLRTLRRQLREGKITPEKFALELGAASIIHKWAQLALKAEIASASHGKKIKDAISKSNLISDGECIDMQDDVEVESILCPDMDKAITRAECLDYSGDHQHMDDCQSCGNFVVTRERLLGAA